MAQAVLNLCVSRKVFLKYQFNWNTVWGAIYRIEVPRSKIWFADNPVEVLNEYMSLLVGRYVPTRVIRIATRIRFSLMINVDVLLASSWGLIFGGPMIGLGLTGKSLFALK